MKINEIFEREPVGYDIPNLGVAKVGTPQTEQEWDVLNFELKTFVCEGEYRRGLERILETFVTSLDKAQQPAAWVSGFYGSGKSHFVKVLESLWKDVELPDGATARGVVQLTPEVTERLLELKTQGDRHGGLWAASGRLGAAAGGIRLALLAIVLRSAGLPEEYEKARFVLYFQQQGLLDELVMALERRDTTLEEALTYMTISDELAEAILEVQSTFASGVTEVKTRIENNFPTVDDVSTEDFLKTLTQVLETKSSKPDRLPLTLLVFDELQQFMGGDPEKADELLSVVEDISARLENRILFVATGQSELSATAELQRLQDRFKVRVTLGVTDVETVVRRVILAKKPEAVSRVETAIDDVQGEIDRHLAGTAIAPRPADQNDLVADYPLLPARRRFWESVQRGFDISGRVGQLRTQLRVVHEAVKDVADRSLGWAVAADALFDQERSNMLQSGALLREVASIIDDLAAENPDGELASRLCKLIYLISKVPIEGLHAAGVRSDANMLADLLVEDLKVGGAALRQQIPNVLDDLARRGILLPVDQGEYRLQTKEGTDWQQAYQNHLIACKADLPRLRDSRVDEFKKAIEVVLRDVKVIQGASKVPRRLTLHFGDQPPPAGSGDVPLWVRDEWSETDKRVRDDARGAGVDSPNILVYLPKRNADQLVGAIASLQAREETLNRPSPTTDAGKEARASMQAQVQIDRQRLDDFVAAVLRDAVVLMGGGTEAAGIDLASKLKSATDAAVSRLYPKFSVADNAKWGDILPAIKAGNNSPLEKVRHSGEAQDHPVCKELLAFIGNGSAKGSAIRSHFTADPFGWPPDAVNGALMALVAAGQVVAKRNGKQVEAKSFDANTIGGADFERESNVVAIDQRIALRALAKDVSGLVVKGGDEADGVRQILDSVRDLAAEAGGEAPLPAKPDTDEIERLRGYVGNEQLIEIFKARDAIKNMHSNWTARKARIQERLPHWARAQELVEQAASLPIADEVAPAIKAILDNRLLLDDNDPTGDIRQKLGDALRNAVTDAHTQLELARSDGLRALEATTEWAEISADQRNGILQRNQLTPVTAPEVGSDEQVVETLRHVPLEDWEDKLAAIPGRLDAARKEAARILEPDSIEVKLPKKTIKSPEDLEEFLSEVRRLIEERLGEGPIIV